MKSTKVQTLGEVARRESDTIARESRYTLTFCAFKIDRASGPGGGKPVLNISACALSASDKMATTGISHTMLEAL